MRGALRVDRRHAAAIALIGTVLLVGFLIAATVVQDRAEALDRAGTRLQGEVVGTGARGRLVSGSEGYALRYSDRCVLW